MSADSRFLVSVVCIATACALLSAPASAGLFRCWKHADAASKEGVTKVPAQYPCKGQVEVGTFKAAKDVWWGHRNRSFGNYLAFNKVDIPKPRVKKAKPVPKFQHILFDLDKSTLKPDAVAIADKVVAYLKANPSEKVCIGSSGVRMIPFFKSASPPKISIILLFLDLISIAIVLIVKSRLEISS